MLDNDFKSNCEEYLFEISQLESSDFSVKDKYINIKQILERLCVDITKKDSIQFSSLFSRIVFICNKYNVLYTVQQKLHTIRKTGTFLRGKEDNIVSTQQLNEAVKTITCFISILCEENRVGDVIQYEKHDYQKQRYIDYIRFEVLSIDLDNKIITGIADDAETSYIKIKYGVDKINSAFDSTIQN
jgi:DNA replication ATP-dependent helicase Dna2